MDHSDAFELLGLPRDATRDEISKRYRQLARQIHAGTPSGSDEDLKALNEARDIALATLSSSTALVPFREVQELVVATTRALSEESSRQQSREALTRQMVRLSTDRHRTLSRYSFLVSGISAALAVLSSRAAAEQLGRTGGDFLPLSVRTLTIVAVTLGVMAR